MLRRTLLILSLCGFGFLAAGTGAASEAATDDLARALQFDRLARLLASEGETYGADLEAELFPGAGGRRWQAQVARIHDPERIRHIFGTAFEEALAGQTGAVAQATAFYSGPLGSRIADLELAAREALADDALREAAELAWLDARAARTARADLLDRLVEAADLVETNVAGALNANLAFYRGMAEGQGLPGVMDEADMLADVWSQEEGIREETANWIYPYLMLAYEPLSDAELAQYEAFWRRPEGRALNMALFAAFDRLFRQVSHDLGSAAATLLQGQDI